MTHLTFQLQPGFVWKNPLRFYPAGLIRINPPGKSQKNTPEGEISKFGDF